MHLKRQKRMENVEAIEVAWAKCAPELLSTVQCTHLERAGQVHA